MIQEMIMTVIVRTDDGCYLSEGNDSIRYLRLKEEELKKEGRSDDYIQEFLSTFDETY